MGILEVVLLAVVVIVGTIGVAELLFRLGTR
jgi:hypothetical protein